MIRKILSVKDLREYNVYSVTVEVLDEPEMTIEEKAREWLDTDMRPDDNLRIVVSEACDIIEELLKR